jgi:hypothetical protein
VSDFETIATLAARITSYIDIHGLSEAQRADLMGAITELAEFTPSTPASSRPQLVVRNAVCTPTLSNCCSAGYIDEQNLSHCCAQTPGHAGQHRCSCGATWTDVTIPQTPGDCGVSRDAGLGHLCVCHLAIHNNVPTDTGEEPLHACAHCGGPWAA